MSYQLRQAGFVIAWALSCQTPLHAQTVTAATNPEIQNLKCFASSFDEHQSGPEVTIAELMFEGDLRMPVSSQNEIATSFEQRTYRGKTDELIREVTERVKGVWQNQGYGKVQVRADAQVLTGSPVSEQIRVTVHVEEGQQYRLKEISFENNRAIPNPSIMRSLFPINDGDIFDRSAIVKGQDNMIWMYRQYGYIDSTTAPRTEYDEEARTVSVLIHIDEGKQFYVSAIRLRGAGDDVLEDSLLQPGDVYNQRLANLFIQEHSPSSPAEGSPESRVHLQPNPRLSTVAITYDLRPCPD
jgi:outer membrane protein assembly factor BamA